MSHKLVVRTVGAAVIRWPRCDPTPLCTPDHVKMGHAPNSRPCIQRLIYCIDTKCGVRCEAYRPAPSQDSCSTRSRGHHKEPLRKSGLGDAESCNAWKAGAARSTEQLGHWPGREEELPEMLARYQRYLEIFKRVLEEEEKMLGGRKHSLTSWGVPRIRWPCGST
jgi:hypothetical protein